MSEPHAAQGFNPMIQGSVDPRLRGGQPILPHGFFKPQMEALVAVCDTFIPSLSIDDYLASTEGIPGSHDETKALSKHELQVLDNYLHLSASDANLPLETAGLMTKLLKRCQAWLIHLALWMLATRLGTLILGGKHAIISTFPFIGKFASLPPHKRYKLMLALSQSCIYCKQELFRFFKSFVCWSMLTKVDAFGGNPMFEAIKYQVGEDEDTVKEKIAIREEVSMKEEVQLMKGDDTFKEEDFPKKEDATSKEADVTEDKKHSAHVLTQRVVDADVAGVRLGDELVQLGVEMLTDVVHLEALRRRRRTKRGEDNAVVGIKCDVVIAGSGPGGAVVAAKLAKAGYKVVVVEKGGYYPVGTYSQLEGPSMYAMYEEGGCLITDDSRIILLAGATVGGGSTVNWAASFRTPGHVRNEWAQALQLDLFASPAYELAMHAVCSRQGVQSHVAHENFCNSVLRAGSTSLGIHVDNIPRNSPPDHQCGFCGLGCQQGKKQGAMLTWLEDAAQAGALLISSCNAEEILTRWTNQKRRTVAGLVARAVNAGVTVYVEADVVVSACGALRTPPLLRQSGLRNAAIGRNLHIHPVQVVWGHFEEGCGPAGTCYRGGIMTAFSNVAANWDTSGYGALIQCPGTQPGLVAIGMPWVSGLDFKMRFRKFARTALFIVLARDQGGGHVTVDVDGRLCVRYQLAEVDKESLRNGAEHGLRILKAAGACEVGAYNTDGEAYVVSKDATSDSFEAFLGRVRERSFQKLSTVTVSAHQMGSCRMGVHPSSSAVRPNGETWEVDGLFVSDSSVFPTATGVNPMVTVQSIAYCTADSILSHLEQKLHS